MPLSRHPLWEQFVGGLTMIKYLGVACLLYAFIHLFRRRIPLNLLATSQARWLIFLALMATASFLIAGAPTTLEVSPLFSYISFVVLFVITLIVVDSLNRLRWVLLASIGSVGFASLYVLREWQKYHAVYAGFRPGWITGDANYFTVSAVLCLPLAFYLMREPHPWWQKIFCGGCFLLTMLSVTLAASRGGFLGATAAFLFVIWRSHHRSRNLVLLGVLLVLIVVVAPTSTVERFLHPSHGDIEAIENRLGSWEDGLRMLWESPLTGKGLGNFKSVAALYATESGTGKVFIAHNTYIELGAELGVLGLVSFLAILVGTFRALERVQSHAASSSQLIPAHFALGLEAGLVGYAVAAFFVSAQYQKLFWLMVFLSMCLPNLQRGSQESKDGLWWVKERGPS